MTVLNDLAEVKKVLADADTDLLELRGGLNELKPIMAQVRATCPDVPVLLATDDDALTTEESLSAGATDMLPDDAPEANALVVRRELAHVVERRRYEHMQRALRETEQRCQLLLQSSSAAIAYVHEGMHIYANRTYLGLFGFDGFEDGFEDTDALLGLPLMDLASSDSADELKAARLPRDAVIFQIMEEDARQYVRQTKVFISGLQALHIRTALGHFDTSAQALDTLRHIPVEFVKISGEDVRQMDSDETARERVAGRCASCRPWAN